VKSTQHWCFWKQGQVLGYFGQLFKNRNKKTVTTGVDLEEEKVGNLRVPRNVVRDILIEKIPEQNIVWDAEVDRIEEHDDFVKVILKKTGKEYLAKLVCACDGTHSKVQKIRRELYGKEVVPDLKYLGVVLITGFTSLKHYLLNNRGFYTVDGNSRMFTMPFEDENIDENVKQKTMWQLSVKCSEEEAKKLYATSKDCSSSNNNNNNNNGYVMDNDLVKKFCLEKTKGWHEPLEQMFATTDFDEVWAGPLYDREEPTKIPNSRIAVLGDASHPMSPFKGQGANTALEDAWLLCEWIDKKSPKNIKTAVKCFHRESFAKAFKRVKASREACEILHDEKKAFHFYSNEISNLTLEQAKTFVEAMRVRKNSELLLNDQIDNVGIDEQALDLCQELGFFINIDCSDNDALVERGDQNKNSLPNAAAAAAAACDDDDDDDDDGREENTNTNKIKSEGVVLKPYKHLKKKIKEIQSGC
jgi:2-polyprenyl-6-methoxyphenol hydroxylase-like FAD-dependent oxidoreductase